MSFRLWFAAAAALALAAAGVARAGELRVVDAPVAADVSMPFACDWGYDWDERCYRDDSTRLGVGGAGDKVWRTALRFALDAVPAQAVVVTAELSLFYDRTCTAPFRRVSACDGRGYRLDAHPIFTARWDAQREVEEGPSVASAWLDPLAGAGWTTWDVTDLVSDWHTGGLANDGVLLQLPDDAERRDAPGPAFPSSSFADTSVRPRLRIWYLLE